MSDEKTLRLLAVLAVAVGFLGACDAAYEITHSGFERPASGFGFVLGVLGIAGGLALLRRRRHALELVVLAAAAGFFHSAIALVQVAPNLFNLLTILAAGSDPRLWSEYGSRLVLIVIGVLFWPILLGLLYIDLQCRSPEDPATRQGKRTFWACVGSAVLIMAVAELLLQGLRSRHA